MPSYDPLEDARLLEVDTYRGRIQAFCDMAGLNDLAGRSVVTIGSALGGEVIAAAQLKAETVIGFEIKDELVVRAREVAATFDLPVTFGQFDGVNLPPMGTWHSHRIGPLA